VPPTRIPIYGVDAFTSEPFRGNPAAVCLLDSPADESWMQSIATEMNLSETAFVVTTPAPDGTLGLRWFTPTLEVALCGHATLASAHVLWETGRLGPPTTARFATASGILVASRAPDRIELDFPALPNTPVDAPPTLAAALGTTVVATARNTHDLLVELTDAATVRDLTPDLDALAAIDVRAVVVTAPADPDSGFDFVSRCFAPRSGIPEDPVTGSAHCALAPYWSPKLGKQTLVGHQTSRRGGIVHCRLDTDRVILAGKATTIWHGELV
jgi:PhzF family phenazine biosynthesis protein